MNEYDCIVYSNDIYGLTVALFLARKMRKVLVLQDSTKIVDNFEVMDIVDPENKKYHFEYNPLGITSGLNKGGLLYEYLDDLGLMDDMNCVRIDEENVVGTDNSFRKRRNDFESLRVYLVRYYPKSRNEIHKFFDDLERHYDNYVLQYMSMLKNTDYTLTSLMIEWGDYSLNELLKKYFTSQTLRKEFLLTNNINGLDADKINSYNHFSNLFVGLKSGFYYLKDSESIIREKIINKLKLINPKSVIKTRIKQIIKDDSDKIEGIVDKNDNKYTAKYYFVEQEPEKFYSKHFSGHEEDIKIINSYYPNFNMTQKINTMYLAVNDYPKNLGIEDLVYYFKNSVDEKVKIIKLFNYSLYSGADKRKKQGLLCLDYTYDEKDNYTKDDLLKRLYEAFPKLKKEIVGIREGTPRKHLTMLNDVSIRKNYSINEMIEIEAMEHIQVFENLYLGSKEFRPEAGIFGLFNQAIVFADKIEDRLYFGEDDDVHSFLTNEEIMMIIRHNFDPSIFNNQEIHVNFHIGKSTYFIRTKGKNIAIHHGKYPYADLSIYTNNDRLSNLLLKKITFNEVLEEGSLKYRGDKDLLFKVVSAFQLDDYQEYSPIDYKRSKYKNQGLLIICAYFFIFMMAALLTNYLNGVFIYPGALLLSGLMFYVKYRSYQKLNWFDIFLNGLFFTLTIMAIFWQTFNQYRMDDILLIVMAVTLLASVAFNRPVVFNYTKFDRNIDYRNSVLYKVITNGLTFFWAVVMLAIIVGTYIAGERYVSVLYNLYFIGVFLMFFYPVIYVRTNIKQ